MKGELEQMLPLWQTLRVPITVIQGEADQLVPAANAAFVKKQAVNAPLQIIMVPQMNHFIPWERPILIRDAILSHLKMQK